MTGGFARSAADATSALRVVKLGGSLLNWPELAARLRAFLACQPPAANVLIVGGGALVDKLRELDQVHPLPPYDAHWLAVRAMSRTAAAAAKLLGDVTLAASLAELRMTHDSTPQILDAEQFLRDDAGSPHALPESWHVTSDSIAARVAKVLCACELVLLKSALPAGPASSAAWSHLGFVDAYFPRAAAGLTIRAVNLRDADFVQSVTA